MSCTGSTVNGGNPRGRCCLLNRICLIRSSPGPGAGVNPGGDPSPGGNPGGRCCLPKSGSICGATGGNPSPGGNPGIVGLPDGVRGGP